MYKNLEDIVWMWILSYPINSYLSGALLKVWVMRSLDIQMFEFSKVSVLSKVLGFQMFVFSKVWVFKCLNFQKFWSSKIRYSSAGNVCNQSIRMLSCVLVYYLWIFDVDVDEKKNRTIEAVRTLLYICIHCGECSCIVVLFKYKNERIQMPHKSKNILITYTFEQPKIK